MRTKIVEIGLGQTGTRSVAQAVAWMGYKARHGLKGVSLEMKQDYAQCLMEGVPWGFGLYDEFDFVGNVSLLHWELLLEFEPEMKFILSLRGIDGWIAAARAEFRTRRRRMQDWRRVGSIPFDQISTFGPLMLFGSYVFQEDIWRAGFERYYEQAREAIPADRLFEVDVFRGDKMRDLADWLDSPNKPPQDLVYPKKKKSGVMNSKNYPW